MEHKISPKVWIIVMIIVAIVGCIGVITAAIIEKMPDDTFSEIFSLKPNNQNEFMLEGDNSKSTTLTDSELTESNPTVHDQQNDVAILSTTLEENDNPLRPHQNETIGSGVFEIATFSDGKAEILNSAIVSQHYKIQLINPDTSDNGCEKSWYSVEEIWFSGASKTSLLLNGEVVGEIFLGNGKHGHIINISVNIGDELCVYPIPPGGFHINFGPDLYYHYDSYCYRFEC